jgi:hypothetical protein
MVSVARPAETIDATISALGKPNVTTIIKTTRKNQHSTSESVQNGWFVYRDAIPLAWERL